MAGTPGANRGRRAGFDGVVGPIRRERGLRAGVTAPMRPPAPEMKKTTKEPFLVPKC